MRGPASATLLAALAGVTAWPEPARAADEDIFVELHFMPVPDVQIAIWLARPDGTFVQDVFLTQATGTLGIGNRGGRWDFLSSWRFPYGPRTGVLPIWAHARGQTYPKLVFFDDDLADQESLGWHENSSSPEPFYCRPLTAEEHQTISVDTMTCPSPATFQSDKGRFADAGEQSVYPPRNDLMEFEELQDSPDAMMLSALNDVDAITGATPLGDEDELVTTVVPREVAEGGPLVAWIEVSLEHDENPDWEFDRENDHYVDPRLENFGIEYLGQPSIVYAIEFDPMQQAFTGTDMYSGYADMDGATGTVHTPDSSISTDNGSGADRLRLYEKNGEIFRFGVYSHGPDTGGMEPPGGDDGGTGGGDGGTDTGGGDSAGDGGGDSGGNTGGGWGCELVDLPPLEDVEVEAIDFDRVQVTFTVPQVDSDIDLDTIRLYHRMGEMELDDTNASSAIQMIAAPDDCGEAIAPGVRTWCEIDQLFGNFEYQVGARLEDECNNRSSIVAAGIKTPAQKFATVDGACFVATAAWGAPWVDRVRALRWFRDAYLRKFAVGAALVDFYYAYSPPLADVIADRPALRGMARALLAPFADTAKVVTGS